MIQLINLSKSFGQKEVLKDINATFEKGKTYGIVGQNGAGKTTLFKCIAGLESYNGIIKSEHTPLKNHIGFLETNPPFMSLTTAAEYLHLMAIARGRKFDNFHNNNIFELPLNEYAENYSTGMKKKLALTGILIQQNDYFILDEPYNGVDINSNFIITALIEKLKSAGKTIFIASHIFSTLQAVCDEIIVLKNGSFEQRVFPKDFEALDQKMKSIILGNKIEQFNI